MMAFNALFKLIKSAPLIFLTFLNVMIFLILLWYNQTPTSKSLETTGFTSFVKKSSTIIDMLDQEQKTNIFLKAIEKFIEKQTSVLRNKQTRKGYKFVLCRGVDIDASTTLEIFLSCLLFGVVSERIVLLEHTQTRNFEWPFYWSVGSLNVTRKQLSLQTTRFHEVKEKDLACKNLHSFTQFVQLSGMSNSLSGLLLNNPYHNLYKILPEEWFSILFSSFINESISNPQVKNFKSYFTNYVIAVELDSDTSFPPTHLSQPSKELVFQAAETLSRQAPLPYNQITWFLITSKASVAKWFQEKRLEGSVIWYPPSLTTSDEQKKNAIADTFQLLLHTDDIVSIEGSMFTQVAAAIRGIKPVVCNSYGFCLRRTTLYPPQFRSNAEEKSLSCYFEDRAVSIFPSPDMSEMSLRWIKLNKPPP